MREAFEIQSRFFHEMEFDDFAKHPLDPKVKTIVTFLYDEKEEQLVGYTLLNLHRVSYRNRPVNVYTAEVIIEKKWRGKVIDLSFFYLDILFEFLKNPFKKTYVIDVIVNPGAYVCVSHNIHKFWPLPDHKDEELCEVGFVLSEGILSPVVNEQTQWIRKTQWKHKPAGKTNNKIKSTYRKEIKFFKQMCPNFSEGEGLLFVVPVTLTNLLMTAVKGTLFYLGRRKV